MVLTLHSQAKFLFMNTLFSFNPCFVLKLPRNDSIELQLVGTSSARFVPDFIPTKCLDQLLSLLLPFSWCVA